MERWVGRTAVVTNTANDTGRAICRELLRHRLKVVSCDIRYAGENRGSGEIIHGKPPGELHTMRCNMLRERNIDMMFNEIERRLHSADICINISDLPVDGQVFPLSNDIRRVALENATENLLENEIPLIADEGKILHIRSAPPELQELTSIYSEMSYLTPIDYGGFSRPHNVEVWKMLIPTVHPAFRLGVPFSAADIVNEVIGILTHPPEQQMRSGVNSIMSKYVDDQKNFQISTMHVEI